MDATELSRRIGRTIRAHRLAQGRSLGDLARGSGLSKTILARIESGAGNPSIETLWRVSGALSLPLGVLLEEESAPRVRTIRARSGEGLHADSGMVTHLVHAEGREHRGELHELVLPAGTEHRTAPHLPGVEEVVVCTEGRLRAGPDDAPAELGPGDAVWFVADGPHSYVPLDGPAHALCWMLYVGGTA